MLVGWLRPSRQPAGDFRGPDPFLLEPDDLVSLAPTVGTRPLSGPCALAGDAFPLPFRHGLPFSLSHGTDDRQRQAIGRRARVERLAAGRLDVS